MPQTVLVTGHAGFIGYHVARALLARGDRVVGIDVVNDYYDVALKEARLDDLEAFAGAQGAQYHSVREDLADETAVDALFDRFPFDRVIHLAAQAGVRYSLENPRAYVHSNIVGFTNILEACRAAQTPHLTYASTSSAYGANTHMPFSEHESANHPMQFYAATKRANELMAHSYSHLYGLPTTGLRFFTVYGPWGRPDMAPMIFARTICEGGTLKVFNHGNHSRDFTYIDDIVDGIVRASDQPATPNPDWDSNRPDPASSAAPWRIFNIGCHEPVKLMDFIDALQQELGKTAKLELLPLQPGDVPDTYADVTALEAAVGYRPRVSVGEGVRRFIAWYRDYSAR